MTQDFGVKRLRPLILVVFQTVLNKYQGIQIANMLDVEVKKLPIPSLYLGEGPYWDETTESLLFVDFFHKNVCRYFVNTGRYQVLHIDDGAKVKTAVSLIVPIKDMKDWYVVGVGNTLCGIQWKISDPDQFMVKPKVIQVFKNCQINDGKCDPQGRLWAGTILTVEEAEKLLTFKSSKSIYRIDSDLSWHECVDKVSEANGIAWSPGRKSFYYNDSGAYTVNVLSYDDASGVVGDQVVLLDYKKLNLVEDIPDGMTTDVDGNLWVANWNGSKVICANPVTGKIIQHVNLPSKNVTSVCWGGPDYSTLFVTSAKWTLSPEELKEFPDAGATFAVTGLGTRGSRANSFKPDLKLFKERMGL